MTAELALVRSQVVAEEAVRFGRPFTQETGALQGLRLALGGALGPAAAGAGNAAWQWRAGLDWQHGNLDYLGQNAFGLLLASRTALERQQAGADLVHRRTLAPGLAWRIGSGARLLRQHRRIEPTAANSSLVETLDALSLRLGSGLDLSGEAGGRRWLLVLEAAWTRPLWQRLVAEAPGAFDAAALHPARRDGGDALLRGTLSLSPAWTLSAEAGVVLERPGASRQSAPVSLAGQPVGQISYPGSVQTQRTLALGLSRTL